MSTKLPCLITLFTIVSLTLSACGGAATMIPVTVEQIMSNECSYLLPFTSNGDIPVSQSISDPSNKSHTLGSQMEYAIDFAMPEGTPVLSARAGIVSKIHSGETAYGNQRFANNANYVIIDHRDGTYAIYLHLQSVSVIESHVISQGELLGYSGKTGWTYGRSHLHFQVQTRKDGFGQSVPFCFSDVPGGVPQVGQIYVPANPPPSISGYVSGQATVEPQPTKIEDASPLPPLDMSDTESIVAWFAYALETDDMDVMRRLFTADTVNFGHGLNADGGRVNYPTEVFLEWMDQRIQGGSYCLAYNASVNSVTIWTRGWNPHWPTPWQGNDSVYLNDELTFFLYRTRSGSMGWDAHFSPSYLILDVPSVKHKDCPQFGKTGSVISLEQLVGTWEGQVTIRTDIEMTIIETHRLEFTADCPLGGICLRLLTPSLPQHFPVVQETFDPSVSGEFCFGEEYQSFCFTPLPDESLDFNAGSPFSLAKGVMHRINE